MPSDALHRILDDMHADELRSVVLRLAAMSGESGRVAAETSVLAQLKLRDVGTSSTSQSCTPTSIRRLCRAAIRCSRTLAQAHTRPLERGGLTPLYSLILEDSRSHAARRPAPAIPMFVTLPDSTDRDSQ